MRRYLALAAATSLLGASSAHAAMGVRLSISTRQPRSGERVAIFLRPFTPYQRRDGSCCIKKPAKVRYPFRLQALGPGGRNVFFKPRRTRNPFLWKARFRFSRPGAWRIRIANYYYSHAHAEAGVRYRGPQLPVNVRP